MPFIFETLDYLTVPEDATWNVKYQEKMKILMAVSIGNICSGYVIGIITDKFSYKIGALWNIAIVIL